MTRESNSFYFFGECYHLHDQENGKAKIFSEREKEYLPTTVPADIDDDYLAIIIGTYAKTYATAYQHGKKAAQQNIRSALGLKE